MKKLLAILVLIPSIVAGTSLMCSAADYLIGVIDVVVIIEQSIAGKRADAQLAAEIRAKQAVVDDRAAELQTLQEKLQAEDLADDVRAALEADYAQLLSDYQQLVTQSENEVQTLAEQLRNQLLQEIGQVVGVIAQREGYTLILEAANVVYFGRHIDITAEVIREWDKYYATTQ